MKEINIQLKEPSVEYKESFLRALDEYTREGRSLDEGIAEPGDDFAAFVQSKKDESAGVNLKDGRVPQSTFWIVDGDGYAGRISIRHTLNEKLLKKGGHIGYGIIPSKRGQGYATKALELMLPRARALDLKKVLLTCDSTNTASKKIIEGAGGFLENEIPGEDGMPSTLRFWIEL
ncbi:MAG: GNAT family N-acetyltransferase [bacterium]